MCVDKERARRFKTPDDDPRLVAPLPATPGEIVLDPLQVQDPSHLEAVEAGLRDALRRANACKAALLLPDVMDRNRALLSLVRRVPFAPVFLEDYSSNPSDASPGVPDALEGEILGLIQFPCQDAQFLAGIGELTPPQLDCLPDRQPQVQEIWGLLAAASQIAAPIAVRLGAIRWLERCWWSPHEDLLKAEIPKLLADVDPRVRAAAVVHLRRRYWAGFPQARDILLQAARSESEPFVRLLLIQALSRVEALDAYAAEIGVPFVVEAAFRDGKAYWICAAPGGLVPFATCWSFRAFARAMSSAQVTAPSTESLALPAPREIRNHTISVLSFDPPLEPGPYELWIEARAEPALPAASLSSVSSRRQLLEWGVSGSSSPVTRDNPGGAPLVPPAK